MSPDFVKLFESLNEKTQASVVAKWRRLALKEVRAFAKEAMQSTEFRTLKLRGSVLKVRPEGKHTLGVWGKKQNAGVLFGFHAPVNVRKPSKPYVIEKNGRHITMRTRQEFSHTLGSGLIASETKDRGETYKPDGAYFGVLRKGKVQARALVRRKSLDAFSVPVFHDRTLPDFLFKEKKAEIDAIILACGEIAIQNALNSQP